MYFSDISVIIAAIFLFAALKRGKRVFSAPNVTRRNRKYRMLLILTGAGASTNSVFSADDKQRRGNLHGNL